MANIYRTILFLQDICFMHTVKIFYEISDNIYKYNHYLLYITNAWIVFNNYKTAQQCFILIWRCLLSSNLIHLKVKNKKV